MRTAPTLPCPESTCPESTPPESTCPESCAALGAGTQTAPTSLRLPLRLALLAALAAGVVAVSLVLAPPAAATVSLERAAVAKLNAIRRAHDLPRLVVRSDLRRAAHRHSAAMALQNTLYHSDLSRVRRARSAAENVAFGANVISVHRMLLGSTTHRANILNPRMRQVGVAVRNVNGQLWVTQIFRQPR